MSVRIEDTRALSLEPAILPSQKHVTGWLLTFGYLAEVKAPQFDSQWLVGYLWAFPYHNFAFGYFKIAYSVL